jgi:hypothetical protein
LLDIKLKREELKGKMKDKTTPSLQISEYLPGNKDEIVIASVLIQISALP